MSESSAGTVAWLPSALTRRGRRARVPSRRLLRLRSKWARGVLLLPLVLATACSSSASSGSAASSVSTSGLYPVTIKDCNGTTTYTKPPSRVFVMDSYMSEMMVALGLTGKMVGVTKFIPDYAMPEPYRAALSTVPTVGGADGNYASREAMIATHPDLVMSIYPSAFAAATRTVPTPAQWKQLGANTYQAVGECNGTTPSFALYYQDLRNIARIFGVPGRAEAAISQFKARLSAADAQAAKLPVRTAWVFGGGTGSPYTVGSQNWSNLVIAAAHLTNVFADVPGSWVQVSMEQVLERQPQVTWIQFNGGGYVPGPRGDGAQIVSQLKAEPGAQSLLSVKNSDYVYASYKYGAVENPLLATAVVQLVDQLAALPK